MLGITTAAPPGSNFFSDHPNSFQKKFLLYNIYSGIISILDYLGITTNGLVFHTAPGPPEPPEYSSQVHLKKM